MCGWAFIIQRRAKTNKKKKANKKQAMGHIWCAFQAPWLFVKHPNMLWIIYKVPYSINQDAITWKGQEKKETRKQSSELPYTRYSKTKKEKSVDKIENIGKYKKHNQGKCRKIQKIALINTTFPLSTNIVMVTVSIKLVHFCQIVYTNGYILYFCKLNKYAQC